MEWKWLKNRKVKLCMEIGLALVLAIVLGAGGSYMEKRTQEEELQANVAAENEAAREAEKMPAKQDPSEEVFADGQYPIMGNSDVTAQQLAEYYNASGAKYRKNWERAAPIR